MVSLFFSLVTSNSAFMGLLLCTPSPEQMTGIANLLVVLEYCSGIVEAALAVRKL
jgi:hypothetical protein